jgi:ankyrin repeat protein
MNIFDMIKQKYSPKVMRDLKDKIEQDTLSNKNIKYIDENGDTPLLYLLKNSKWDNGVKLERDYMMIFDLCELLPNDINFRDQMGRTPLYHAIAIHNVFVQTMLVQTLVEDYHCDLNLSVDMSGKMPLDFANNDTIRDIITTHM